MKKLIILFFVVIFIVGLSFTTSHADDLKLVIKKAECVSEEEVAISYGVINTRNYYRHNISVCFKIMADGKPAGCKEIITAIPGESDESELNEIIINAPCKGKPSNLSSTIFYNTKRYRIDEWFSGCPD